MYPMHLLLHAAHSTITCCVQCNQNTDCIVCTNTPLDATASAGTASAYRTPRTAQSHGVSGPNTQTTYKCCARTGRPCLLTQHITCCSRSRLEAPRNKLPTAHCVQAMCAPWLLSASAPLRPQARIAAPLPRFVGTPCNTPCTMRLSGAPSCMTIAAAVRTQLAAASYRDKAGASETASTPKKRNSNQPHVPRLKAWYRCKQQQYACAQCRMWHCRGTVSAALTQLAAVGPCACTQCSKGKHAQCSKQLLAQPLHCVSCSACKAAHCCTHKRDSDRTHAHNTAHHTVTDVHTRLANMPSHSVEPAPYTGSSGITHAHKVHLQLHPCI